MRINHNISALKANNQLARTNNKLDDSLEKLSSGLRINSAADDSAGLAISEKMRTQISGLNQASRNASDGISVIQTAEGALIEVESMLQRMRELSVQSANGIYTTDDRIAIQSEIDQLNQEITRISETTEFNTMKLLDGNIDRKSYSSDNKVSLVSMSDTVTVGDYGVKITQDARQAVVVGHTTDFNGLTAMARKITASEAGSISINGEGVSVKEGDTVEQVFEKIRNACDNVDVNVFATVDNQTPSTTQNYDMAGYTTKSLEDGDQLVFVSREYGTGEKIEINCDSPGLCDILGLTIKGSKAQGYDAKAEVVLKANDAKSKFENTATVSIQGNKMTISDRNDFSMVFEVEPGTVGSVFTDASITSNTLDMLSSYPPNTFIVGGHGVTVTQDARQAVVLGNIANFTGTSATTITALQAGTITINGTTVTAAAGDSIASILALMKAANPAVSVITVDDTAVPSATTDFDTAGYTDLGTFAPGDRVAFISDDFGKDASIKVECNNALLGDIFGLTTISGGAIAEGYDAKVELVNNMTGVTVTTDGDQITITDGGITTNKTIVDGEQIGTIYKDALIVASNLANLSNSFTSPGASITASVLDAGPMDLQIGANEGQIMSVRIPKVTPKTLGVDKINIGTADGAQEAIGLLDIAINQVSAIRSKLGAYQNRLEHSISNLDVTSENMTESLSRIEDVDMAEEMAEYTQKNVLAQAGTSMLAQANQRPQSILSLLQN